LNASTATIYRHTFGPAWDERGETGPAPEAKDAFSIEIATAWEDEFFRHAVPGVRQVALRSAMVLGHGGNSVFPALRKLVHLGLGGHMASGEQFVSWIHQADFCRAVEWIIAHDELSGVVNLAAPNPVANREMMHALRQLYSIPFGLAAPLWVLEVGAFFLRTETELVIKSRRTISSRLPASGFRFRMTGIEAAFRDLADIRHPQKPLGIAK
jgi:NAD dependent epimerase/dehydratase family enzyme